MKKRVLIMCTGNSARSQMAEGLLRAKAGNRFEVSSAGTRPVGLNPNAVSALEEVGIDISHQRSKSVDEFAGQHFDYVITVCDHARDSCPIFLGSGTHIHRSFIDPAAAAAEEQPNAFRHIRDEIKDWIEEFVASVETDSESSHRIR